MHLARTANAPISPTSTRVLAKRTIVRIPGAAFLRFSTLNSGRRDRPDPNPTSCQSDAHSARDRVSATSPFHVGIRFESAVDPSPYSRPACGRPLPVQLLLARPPIRLHRFTSILVTLERRSRADMEPAAGAIGHYRPYEIRPRRRSSTIWSTRLRTTCPPSEYPLPAIFGPLQRNPVILKRPKPDGPPRLPPAAAAERHCLPIIDSIRRRPCHSR